MFYFYFCPLCICFSLKFSLYLPPFPSIFPLFSSPSFHPEQITTYIRALPIRKLYSSSSNNMQCLLLRRIFSPSIFPLYNTYFILFDFPQSLHFLPISYTFPPFYIFSLKFTQADIALGRGRIFYSSHVPYRYTPVMRIHFALSAGTKCDMALIAKTKNLIS